MADINIDKFDETFIYIDVDNEGILYELNDHFSFYVKNYKHMPKYKLGIWDGKWRAFNVVSQMMHGGLIHELIRWALDNDYSLDIDPDIHLARKDDPGFCDVESLMESFNLPFKPYDYQIEAVETILKHRKRLVLSPTSSGKSFIIYSAIRALLAEIGRPQRRILLVVPTTSLVEQMVGDFAEYSENNEFDAEKMCHKIYSGREKHNKCPVTVSTWQSIYKKGQKWFEHFDTVIVDEAHLASGDCITKLMEKCVNAEFRIGLTGTIEDAEVHEMTLTGLFGRIFETISTKELMDRGMVSKLKIKCILFDHDATTKQAVSKLNYADEIDRIITDDKKNRFVADLALRCKGNTLILFNFVERHGIPLYELVNSLNKQGKKVFLVHGDVSVDERERIRAYTEAHDNVIIIASYGTFSTGINIKNLQNVIFAHPFKSKIKILQSIGRVLRKCATSSKAVLFDLANDFRHKSKVNITMKHFKERLKLYDKSKFEYTIKVLKL